MPELLATILLAACCLSPATSHPSTADQLLAASERMGQMQRPINYPPSNPQETDRG